MARKPAAELPTESAGAPGPVLIGGRYQILGALSHGASGVVHLAEVVGTRRRVCIKMLHPELAADVFARRRFEQEALLAGRVDHPHVVAVLDHGSHQPGSADPPVPFVVMEFIRGRDLFDVLRLDAPLALARAIRLGRQIAMALDALHRHAIIHRDLKPANVMVRDPGTDREVVKLLDLGIAKAPGEHGETKITKTGLVCGTPQYMSPEQILGEPIDTRADLYALGVLLYELATDELPFEGETALELMEQHVHQAPKSPALLVKGLPPGLVELILALLQKPRDARPQNARQVVRELTLLERIALRGAKQAAE